MNSVQVWVSPNPREINNLRQVVAFSDLGEFDRFNGVDPNAWTMGQTPVIDPQYNEKLPTNQTNKIYAEYNANPALRQTNLVVSGLQRPPFNFAIGRDFEVFKGQLLDQREYTAVSYTHL